MAKRPGNRGIFLKSVARMRRDAGPFGGRGMAVAMQAMCDKGREGSPEGWPCQCSLADEDAINRIYEQRYAWDDDPALHPGAIVSWARGGFGVTLGGDALRALLEEPLGDVPTDGLLESIWPCALIDARPCGLELYGSRVGAVLCYPTYDAGTGRRVIGVVGLDPDGTADDVMCAKVAAEGRAFGEVADLTRSAYETERSLAEAGIAGILPRVDPYQAFDPLAVEPGLGDLAIRLLAAMARAGIWQESREGNVPVRVYSAIAGGDERAEFLASVRNDIEERGAAVNGLFEQAFEQAKEMAIEQREREEAEADERERLKAERAERDEQKRAAKERKAAERARRKAENIAEARRKAEAKARKLEERERKRAEQAELSAIAAEIRRMEAEEAEAGADDGAMETPDDAAGGVMLAITEAEAAANNAATADAPEDAASAEVPDQADEEASILSGLLPGQDEKADDGLPPAPSTSDEASWVAYELRRLADENARLRERLAAAESRASFAERMQVPATASEALALALDAFPDRLVAVPAAFDSAEGYKGDVAEAWAVLQAMACTLHPLVFGGHAGSLAREFQSACGFELALRDVKQENRRAEASGSRKVAWKSGTRDMTPHVKGRGSKRGQTLRAHFFADYDERLIVVCHFGEHMPSYQTSSI